MPNITQQKPATCDVCDKPPTKRTNTGWACTRCYRIWTTGLHWRDMQQRERKHAAKAYEEIRKAHAEGYPETTIATLMGVDRMTVRRALGKLR